MRQRHTQPHTGGSRRAGTQEEKKQSAAFPHLPEGGEGLQVALERRLQPRKRLPQRTLIVCHVLQAACRALSARQWPETLGLTAYCNLQSLVRQAVCRELAHLLQGAALIAPQAGVVIQLPALLAVLCNDLPARSEHTATHGRIPRRGAAYQAIHAAEVPLPTPGLEGVCHALEL